ncbi:MAG: 6-carboxytetrahydropterin synthase [Chitinophagaceae bacterium]|nr:6-carboxytetrahydropterin synthase [Chitinophagaceae bacterium]
MLRLTKIFHFEMAHAIHGYQGACKNIHGHSYELHVTLCTSGTQKEYIPSPGFIIDFKQIKNLVHTSLIDKFDHSLLLSKAYISEHPSISGYDNLIEWEVEPSAENILLYMQQIIQEKLPIEIRLVHLKLYETKDSFAEWLADD